MATQKQRSNSVPASAPVFDPADLLTPEQLAERLHVSLSWVREKVRPRSPNPLPVFNLGKCLRFFWPDVCEWIRNSPRPRHAPHRRRRKTKKAAAKAAS